MKTIFKNLLNVFVSFNLIVLPAFGSSGPIAEERTLDKINTFLTSGTPSDIPFIDYMDNFVKDSTQPLKQFDLTGFDGKRVFLGYGVYDKEQNFCKYVEKPGMEDPNLYFQKITTFNKHSYALSMTTMNYDTCVNLANNFNGTPVSITSAAENGFVSGKYGGFSKWIGLERGSCLEEYVNKDGKKQEYFNWSSLSETGGSCENSKLNAAQNIYGTWNKKDRLELNHCLIEVDTEDINRPVKICAPWWRIEREFKKETETTFFGVDVYKINQADIPEQFNVCTKYEETAIAETLERPNREVTCTSYYDSMIAEECLKNPKQDICFIDECNGYIKNACRLTNTLSGFKDYTKAEGIVSGANTIMKGKVDIKTHVYECPPSPPSLTSCEEKSTVIIFPKECPNSDCEGYKQCVQDSTTLLEKNECSSKFVCEKIYGNPDNTEFNADGTLKYLKNTCSDGTVLNFEPSIQDKSSKKCLEYEYYTIDEEVSQKCTLDRPFTDHTLDTSLTEEDIYMNDPKCIRMNNVSDARPTVQVNINYKNMGFAQTVIKKTYLDGDENINVQAGNDDEIVNAAMNVINPFENLNTADSQVVDYGSNIDCSLYSQSWEARNNTILNNEVVFNAGLPTEKKYIASSISSDNAGSTLFAKYLNIPDLTTCNNISAKLSGIGTDYDSLSKVCNVFISKQGADKFSLIKGNGSIQSFPSETVSSFPNIDSDADCLSLQISNNGVSHSYSASTKTCEIYSEDSSIMNNAYTDYTYITNNAISKSSCDEIAYCFNGIYNESAYASSALAQCQITAGENYEYVDKPVLDAIDLVVQEGKDENCVPLKTDGAYLSQLDGTQDIFSIQEVVTGDFGYYSNYNSHPFANNIISINDKEVYPIKPMPVLDDALIYEGNFTQTSIMTKKPNMLAAYLTGGVAMTAISSATGMIIGSVVFIIAQILFAKKQKFNEQTFKWIIYKLVPQQRYMTNVYGYDHRILTLNEDGTVYVDAMNRVKLVYAEVEGFTGTLKPGDFKTYINNLSKTKEMLLTCLGFFKTDVANITHPVENSVLVDYPKCKLLSWSCDKRNTKSYKQDRDPFFKRMVNNYIGAVNGVSIVVPYLGDYELTAFDQFDNVLGKINITEKEFIESTSSVAKYAQVMFGLNMDLASGINEGTQMNACRYDLMTEWGGGISGIYYENNNTGQNQNCQKSQDDYVQNNSATKISIKPFNSDRAHIINLVKPLPFANRVFLVTLNEKEVREYRCFDDFGNCDSQTSFKTQE